jgi:hypothetical protein
MDIFRRPSRGAIHSEASGGLRHRLRSEVPPGHLSFVDSSPVSKGFREVLKKAEQFQDHDDDYHDSDDVEDIVHVVV